MGEGICETVSREIGHFRVVSGVEIALVHIDNLFYVIRILCGTARIAWGGGCVGPRLDPGPVSIFWLYYTEFSTWWYSPMLSTVLGIWFMIFKWIFPRWYRFWEICLSHFRWSWPPPVVVFEVLWGLEEKVKPQFNFRCCLWIANTPSPMLVLCCLGFWLSLVIFLLSSWVMAS